MCMKHCGFCFDEYTFGSILKGVGSNECLFTGQQLHTCIVKTGYEQNVYSGSALLDMYAECGGVVDARKCFYCMLEHNTVSWNALILGYVEIGDRFNCFSLFKSMHKEGQSKMQRKSSMAQVVSTISSPGTPLATCLEHDKRAPAFSLFSKMQMLGFELDIYTYSSMISSCFEEDITNQGRSLHALVIKRGIEHLTSVSNSLMAMYSGSDGVYMDNAIRIFNEIEFKDHVSWNSMLTGLTQHGFSENALKLFSDNAIWESLQFRQQIHALALRLGYESNEFVTSDLIVMYSKCGTIEDARRSFETSYKQNAVTWNSMMFAYAQHSQGYVTLDLFSQMKISKVRMDHMTFVAVLTACSHNGLVEKGHRFKNYGIWLRNFTANGTLRLCFSFFNNS
ncbi:putative tetratricopeptide-like helical domain superfamily [Helianthus annuus]|nr:putative tetratricopeptide-like helical domain superfamily [Helianthus annuus]